MRSRHAPSHPAQQKLFRLGQMGGVLSPVVIGWAVQTWGSWNYPLLLTAALYFMSACLWLVIDPEQPVAVSAVAEARLAVGQQPAQES